jgi:hypothetical protein
MSKKHNEKCRGKKKSYKVDGIKLRIKQKDIKPKSYNMV